MPMRSARILRSRPVPWCTAIRSLNSFNYAPQTPLVHRRPVLLLPPQINKYYVFDLKPTNSVIGHIIQEWSADVCH